MLARYSLGTFVAAILSAQVRAPVWTELPVPARTLAAQFGIGAANFQTALAAIDLRTAQRLRDGDWDHLIFYLLQSRSFTAADPIEPAHSAAEYMAEHRVPPMVRTRMDAFLAAPASNERMRHFASLLPKHDAARELQTEYARVMAFLYNKEIRCVDQACIADLYVNRGLSSDTSAQAFQSVAAAVAWLSENRPDVKFRRVLILGPGVDLAPRTALREDSPPQVYQPTQVTDLLHPERVDCADVNPLVIEYARPVCTAVYEMNAATRFVDDAHWDLIIATNVLLYLDDRELLLAMSNLRRMLRTGGFLVHNDGRFAADVFGKACGLAVLHFGAVTLDAQRTPPLMDRFVVHQALPR